ncbi:MAG: quinoprotein glucose dehydrogenase [Verrucomicrobiota bacterium]
MAYFPGTGLPARFKDHFFLVDFRGGAVNSGIHTFTLKTRGAGFELVDPQHFIWGVLATDVKFGPEGGLYLSDWVEGWLMTGKGRIYRVHDPALDQDRSVIETKQLLAQAMEPRSLKDLARLLSHGDMRVRQEAQFELADRGTSALKTLADVARQNANQVARLHAIWGIGQVLRETSTSPPLEERLKKLSQSSNASSGLVAASDLLIHLLTDQDAEVRAQSAKVIGECRIGNACGELIKLLKDESARVRFFATMSLGKLGRREALPAVLALIRENANKDPWLRHAGVMALTGLGDMDALTTAVKDDSSAVRMGALLAMRRMERGEIAMFLNDNDPAIVLEAARAINDQPINGAMPDLAAILASQRLSGPAATKEGDRLKAGLHTPEPATITSEPLIRRVLNANFHLGTAENARSLALFAARSNAAVNMRVEAIEELADWPQPSGRDRVVGLWRPVAGERPREDAVEAFKPVLADILHSSPDQVRIAALEAAGRLAVTNAGPIIFELAADRKQAPGVRVEALQALAALNDPRLDQAVNAARTDSNEELRKAATRLQHAVKSTDAAANLKETLKNGTPGEQQTALAALANLPDAAADAVLAEWLDKLQTGQAPKELQLDLLDAAAKRSAASIKAKLAQYQSSLPKDDPLAEYRPCLFGGSAAKGKNIFFERPEASCVRCHKVDGKGADVGPDLSHVGAQKDREYLLESIVLPNKQIAQGFDSVMVTLKNDESYAGVLKSETPTELVLNLPQTGLLVLKKSDIQSRKKALSPMPEGIGNILSKQDLRNLVEFLSSQK